MPLTIKRPPLPSDDKRWRIEQGTKQRHGSARDALIETVHTVQESCSVAPERKLLDESCG